MKKIIIFLLIFIQFSLSEKNLKFLINIFRHGARGAHSDKYFNTTSPTIEYFRSELTGVGQR